MQIDGALIREQGVKFAIVVVKPHVIDSQTESQKARAGYQSIADFAGLPIILASQNSQGRFRYQGRDDIVKFLANTDPARIPWRRFSVN